MIKEAAEQVQLIPLLAIVVTQTVSIFIKIFSDNMRYCIALTSS